MVSLQTFTVCSSFPSASAMPHSEGVGQDALHHTAVEGQHSVQHMLGRLLNRCSVDGVSQRYVMDGPSTLSN